MGSAARCVQCQRGLHPWLGGMIHFGRWRIDALRTPSAADLLYHGPFLVGDGHMRAAIAHRSSCCFGRLQLSRHCICMRRMHACMRAFACAETATSPLPPPCPIGGSVPPLLSDVYTHEQLSSATVFMFQKNAIYAQLIAPAQQLHKTLAHTRSRPTSPGSPCCLLWGCTARAHRMMLHAAAPCATGKWSAPACPGRTATTAARPAFSSRRPNVHAAAAADGPSTSASSSGAHSASSAPAPTMGCASRREAMLLAAAAAGGLLAGGWAQPGRALAAAAAAEDVAEKAVEEYSQLEASGKFKNAKALEDFRSKLRFRCDRLSGGGPCVLRTVGSWAAYSGLAVVTSLFG